MTMSSLCRALYVHVPFCRTLCGYCDFYSQVLDPAMSAPLVDALLAELSGCIAAGMPVFDTVFVGGGTPTALPAGDLERLLLGLGRHTDHPGKLEFTVEVNPATVTEVVAAVLARAGVNRVSVGAQSFVSAELRVLDRTHAPAQVEQTVRTCRVAGLQHFSLDLIFGIPGQTRDSWCESLRAAMALQPEHISCYGLTYELGTPLREHLDTGRVQRVDPDVEADLYEVAMDVLPAAGWQHYELSNFARRGGECRHNLRYWHNEPYVGIGPAAAGFVEDVRYKNVADTAAYVAAVRAGRPPRIEEERLPPERRVRETAMLELRLATGIERGRFQERYGVDPVELFAEAIAPHRDAGLLAVDAQGVRLTRAGLLLADTVIADFVAL